MTAHPTPRPALGYVRVSTEGQTGETRTSLADQRDAIGQLAARLGVRIDRWYEDDGYSGATIEARPAFRQLVADCEARPRSATAPGYVLALNDSRWGRFPNSEEATYWRVHLEKRGWLVRFAEGDDVEDRALRPVLRTIAQTQASQYREAVRANAKRGSRGTASQGFWISRTPYGYRRKVVSPPGRERILDAGQRKAPDERVALVPHPAEAAIVRELFRRYAAGGETLATLVEWLRRAEPGRRWTRQAVRFTLTNPAYVGDVVVGRIPADADERRATRIRPDSEWYGKSGAHEALVGRATFDAVQRRAGELRSLRRGARSSWILTGIVRCRCGATLAGGGAGGRRGAGAPSYRCRTRGEAHADRCPYPGTVLKPWLEDAVITEVGRVVASPRAVRRLEAILDTLLARLEGSPQRELDRVDQERTRIEARRTRLVEAIADGTLTDVDARTALAECRTSLARLADERARIERGALTRSTLADERTAVLDLARSFPDAVRHAPALIVRELLRPWVRSAVFDTSTRELTIEVRHVPALPMADLSRLSSRPCERRPGRG